MSIAASGTNIGVVVQVLPAEVFPVLFLFDYLYPDNCKLPLNSDHSKIAF
jgi:hypothetical protein